MTRVKNGVTTKARHKKVLKEAKGYFGSKHRLYKNAKEVCKAAIAAADEIMKKELEVAKNE